MADAAVVIPVRLSSTRLPNKPLALINGKPMLLHVAEVGSNAAVGDVIIACAEPQLFELANSNGYQAVLTDPELPSGSDRVFAAVSELSKKYSYIVNLQGDMPAVAPDLVRRLVEALRSRNVDIVTAVTPIKSQAELENPNVVKALVAPNGRALYFTRNLSIDYDMQHVYHHVGIYAYRAEALARFVSLPPSPLEMRSRLEQLRALDDGMTIHAEIFDEVAPGVDTMQDLEHIRSIMSSVNTQKN